MRTNPLIKPAVDEVPAHREEAFLRRLGFGRVTAARRVCRRAAVGSGVGDPLRRPRKQSTTRLAQALALSKTFWRSISATRVSSQSQPLLLLAKAVLDPEALVVGVVEVPAHRQNREGNQRLVRPRLPDRDDTGLPPTGLFEHL